MVSLAEILKAKRLESEDPTESSQEDAAILYASYLTTSVDSSLFLAVYKPLILYPYRTDIADFRLYREFLLGPAQYVLNTFQPLDTQKLLELYLDSQPIKEPIHLHRLFIALSELHLCVPNTYQTVIEVLVFGSSNENFSIDKFPDSS